MHVPLTRLQCTGTAKRPQDVAQRSIRGNSMYKVSHISNNRAKSPPPVYRIWRGAALSLFEDRCAKALKGDVVTFYNEDGAIYSRYAPVNSFSDDGKGYR